MSERFFAITTALKRAKLDLAWESSVANAIPFRDVLAAARLSVSNQVNGSGGISTSASNNHSVSAFPAGANTATLQEFLEMWQGLIDDFDRTRAYLSKCARYGLDPVSVLTDRFPTPLPAVANPQITVDSTGDISELCDLSNVAVADVVGAVVGDPAIYVWMKSFLFRVAVTELRSDYSLMRA